MASIRDGVKDTGTTASSGISRKIATSVAAISETVPGR
jgi:hypothetical protein